jgi:F-type H+-transporting ATPase subunit delta
MERAGLIADRYAQALSQTVADLDQLAQVRDELKALARLVEESRELRGVFASPIVGADEKERVAVTLAERGGASQLTRRFLRVVAHNGRLALLPEIARALARRHDERAGVHEVELRSAQPLAPDLRARLEPTLEQLAGGKVRIEERVDPSLIGGLVARIGTRVFDGSLRTRLRRMRSLLMGRASAGLAG